MVATVLVPAPGFASSSTDSFSYGPLAYSGLTIGSLLYCFIGATNTISVGGITSDDGTTFTLVTSTVRSGHTLYLYVADQFTSHTSLNLTADFSDDKATGCVFGMLEVTGLSIAGLASIRQFAINDGPNGDMIEGTFGVACLSANAVNVAAHFAATSGPLTLPTGFISLDNSSHVTPNFELDAIGRAGFTGTNLQWVTAPAAWTFIAFEIDVTSVRPRAFSPGIIG